MLRLTPSSTFPYSSSQTGGSTNAVLHLIAMARTVDVELTIDDFQKVSDRIPYLCDLKPSGKYVFEDLHKVGGTPALSPQKAHAYAMSIAPAVRPPASTWRRAEVADITDTAATIPGAAP